MKDIELKNNESILKTEQELLNAMKNSDVQKLDELLHDDLLFNIANGQTITKTMDLETYRSGNMKISEVSATEHQIRFIHDNAIISLTLK
ncbi:MAG: nuclear transport factor 2 family protein, partial [Flavobacteriaceae bacterium]|nr:nuclear transport factor 2 family protein [Flavobacteriaceae bacterium]